MDTSMNPKKNDLGKLTSFMNQKCGPKQNHRFECISKPNSDMSNQNRLNSRGTTLADAMRNDYGL